MARGKKSGSGGVIAAVVVGGLVLLASVPRDVWIGLGALTIVGFAVYLYVKAKGSDEGSTTVERSAAEARG